MRSNSRVVRAGAFAVVLLLATAGCSSSNDDGAQPQPQVTQQDEGGRSSNVVIALGFEPEDLDPYSSAQNAPDSQVHEQLMGFDQNGQLIPFLAAEMPKQIDELTWQVTLRDGITFHDGTALTAQVAAEAFTELFTNPGGAENEETQDLRPVWESAEAVDDLTLQINLQIADPLIPQKLAFVHIVKPGNSARGASPIGTGPYSFVEWDRGSSIRLERFDNYWGDAPDVDSVEYRILPEISTQMAAYVAGEVDVLIGLSPEDARELPAEQVIEVASGQYPMLVINARDGVTGDVRVRQAMNLAIDREAILESLLGGQGEILPCQPAQPNFIGFNEQLEAYPFDPERASELVEEAGAVGAAVEIVTSEGRWPGDRQQAEAIAAMWSDVGLDASAVVLGVADEYITRITNQQDRPDAYYVSRSTELLDGSNMSSYFQPPPGPDGGPSPSSVPADIADRYTEARNTINAAERQERFAALFKSACEEAHFAYLVSPQALYATSERIEALNPLPVVEPSWSRVAEIDMAS